MDKLNNKIKVVLLSAVFLFLSINSSAADDETKPPINIIDAAKLLYSLPTASDAEADSGLPMSLQPAPNLDFRGGRGGDGEVEDEEAAVRVKDAVMKSLDKSMATMEDSAKSTAKFVMDNTVNKLKTTVSQHEHQTEL